MTLINPRPNPYVGPRSFETGETLYGRDRELQDLLDLLIAERIVLLYSPSGAGKSSLIHAGLVPRLRQVGYHVLPVIRVNQEPPHDPEMHPQASNAQAQVEPVNRYLYSTILSLEEGLPPEQQTEASRLSTLSLAGYLDQRPVSMPPDQESEEPPSQLLIFDQFEEIVTLDPTDQAGKAAFFAQLGAALRDRNRWALISLREDYVAALDPYLRHIPTRLSNRFRLDLLGVSSARQAIQQPVKNSGVDFTQAAVNKLVNDLRQIQVQLPDGSMETRLGPYVEPVQLQVVCFHLWQQLSPDKVQITDDDLTSHWECGPISGNLLRHSGCCDCRQGQRQRTPHPQLVRARADYRERYPRPGAHGGRRKQRAGQHGYPHARRCAPHPGRETSGRHLV